MTAQLTEKDFAEEAKPIWMQWFIQAALRRVLLLLLVFGLGISGIYWVHHRMTHVVIYDARIAADMVNLSAHASGWVTQLTARAGQSVQKDDILAQIDARDIQLQIKELQTSMHIQTAKEEQLNAEYQLADARTQSQVQALDAALGIRRADLEQKKKDFHRAQQLLEKNYVTQSNWEHAKTTLDLAYQAYQQAEAEQHSAQAGRVELEVLTRRKAVLVAEQQQMEVRMGQLNAQLEDRILRSPINGVIDETFISNSEHVAPGQRLILMHSMETLYVDANIKETQIAKIRMGSDARIHVDAYPEHDIEGSVISIGNSATSTFALLPNLNPSGTFTKTTQRIPIKIALSQPELLLKPGMMVEVDIDTTQH